MRARRWFIFTVRDCVAMRDAANEIEDLADRVDRELPELVDRIKQIGAPLQAAHS